jgi:hypothetical protein
VKYLGRSSTTVSAADVRRWLLSLFARDENLFVFVGGLGALDLLAWRFLDSGRHEPGMQQQQLADVSP